MVKIRASFLLGLSFYAAVCFSQFTAPSSCSVVIGSPANGAAHYIDISWPAVTGATNYELQYSTNGTVWNPLYTGVSPFYNHNTGSGGNLPYWYQVRAIQNTLNSAWVASTPATIYSACNAPQLPLLSNPTHVSLNLALLPESPDTNTSFTTYSVFCITDSLFLQANGTLGPTEVFQTRAAWGTVNVTGLFPSTSYCFYAKTRNHDGDVRVDQGSAFSIFEDWTSNVLDTTAASPTNVWWSSDTSAYPPVQYFSTGGCPGGNVGFSGSFNNSWHSFLRSPSVNCTGINQVTMGVDVSNSYFASHPNDKLTFTLFAPTAAFPTGAFIDAQTINGLLGNELLFDTLRNCQNINVRYDLSAVSDKSSVLLFINAFCGYNDASVFSVNLDNMTIGGGGVPNAECLATTYCDAAIVRSNPVDTTICVNGNAGFSITASGYIANYQWQVSTDTGTTWQNLNNGSIYSNVTTGTLNISGASAGMNGSLYRCMLTDSCVRTPASAYAVLTVNPPLTGGLIAGSSSVCAGQNNVIYITQSFNGATYNWSLPSGVTLAGAGTRDSVAVNFSNAAVSGDILVTPSNVCGQGQASQAFHVTVNPPPPAPASVTGNIIPCRNSQQSYFATPVTGATSYTWTVPTGWTGGSSADSIRIITGSASGSISVTANNACGSSIPAVLTLTVITTAPTPPGPIMGPDTACIGSTAFYNVPPVANTNSYLWSLPGGWAGSSTTDSIFPIVGNNSGNITVRSVNSCGSSGPRNLSVVARPAAHVVFNYTGGSLCSHASVITLTGGTPPGGTYSGQGVTGNSFDPSAANLGDNIITYTFGGPGCVGADTAGIAVKLCNGITQIEANDIEIYPNPFGSYFTIRLSSASSVQSVAKLHDCTGREVKAQELPAQANTFVLNTADLPGGIYLLQVISDGKTAGFRKLVKVD